MTLGLSKEVGQPLGLSIPSGSDPFQYQSTRAFKMATYSSCGWPASRAGRWGGAARARASRSGPEVESPGGGPPCKARDTRQSAYGMSGRAGRLRGRAIPGKPHSETDTGSKSPRWKHSRGSESFSSWRLQHLCGCDGNESISYSLVFDLLKEYIMMHGSNFGQLLIWIA